MKNLLLYIQAETNLPPEYTDGYCLFALICVSIPILIVLGIIFSIWYMDTHERHRCIPCSKRTPLGAYRNVERQTMDFRLQAERNHSQQGIQERTL